jgi:RsiW-degrading membrane proteinase PrsW (M82 family)
MQGYPYGGWYTGGYAPYQPWAYGAGAPNGYPYAYPSPYAAPNQGQPAAAGYPPPTPYYYYPVYVRPRRAPGETLALVVSWIVTVFGGLSVLCGLLVALLALVSFTRGGGDSLAVQGQFVEFLGAPLIGGAVAIYYGIRGLLRKPSPRFSLPHPLLFLALTLAVFVTAIVVWHVYPAPGPAIATLPLMVLSAAAPGLTILAFATWRLRMPTSRRHVWMAFIYGSTLAALIALILNTIGAIVIGIFIIVLSPSSAPTLSDPTNPTSQNPIAIVTILLIVSLLAPLVEEGVKPLGAVLLMRRLRSPASAFLMGLSAGVGFAIFESIAVYTGRGEADWVVVGLERVGSGLLHGVGAGMGALGWYYLINGKGISKRWLRGLGGLAYAFSQHALFNGTAVAVALVGPVTQWLGQPFYIGRLPLDRATLVFFIYYAAITAVLVIVTGRLARGPGQSPQPAALAVDVPDARPAAPSEGRAPVGSSV